MDRTSPSFGSMYQALSTQHKDRCPPSKSLDECELRASSPTDVRSLRVKTGEPSFFGRAKVRAAHRENAIRLVANQPEPERDIWGVGHLKTKLDAQTGVKYEALTLGDLERLRDSKTGDAFQDLSAPAPLRRSPSMPRLESVDFDALPVSLRKETPEARGMPSAELTEASFLTSPDRESKRSGVSASTELTAVSFRTPPDPRGAASAGELDELEDASVFHQKLI